jgi:hypothetical protein
MTETSIKALLWNELVPGNYWVYPVGDSDAWSGTDSQFVTVIHWKGGLWLTCDDLLEAVNEAWETCQFVPCRRPPQADVEFQSMPSIEPVVANDDVLMSGIYVVTAAQKAWLASTQSVVATKAQPLINSLLYRIENQAGEPLSEWRSLEALAITEAMSSVVQTQLLSEV